MPDFVWNTLGLPLPSDWEPAVLDREYLLAEDGRGPVLEAKWRRVDGRFSMDKHLKRLSKGVRGAEVFDIDQGKVPEDWRKTVSECAAAAGPFECAPFFWKAPEAAVSASSPISGGRGAVLYNPDTGFACLIQFYETGRRSIKEDAAKVLRGLRDFSGQAVVPWTVFGVRFSCPVNWYLDEHSFQPGRFRLGFRIPGPKGRAQCVLERVGPARAVLKGAVPEEWAQKFYSKELKGMVARSRLGEWERKRGVLSRRAGRGRLKFASGGQMILAGFMHRAKQTDLDDFQTVWDGYDLVSEKEKDIQAG